MSLQEEMQDELDELKREEKKEDSFSTLMTNPEELVKRIASESAKQARGSTSGKLAIVLATLLLAINNIAIGWLQGEQVLTEDVLFTILLGLCLVLTLQILIKVDRYVSTKFRKRDIELDIASLTVTEAQSKIRVDEMREKQSILQKSLTHQHLQAQADLKFRQDMELRVPLYQEAQKRFMDFFAQDDIVAKLQVPPTFVEAVEKMDDILFKRADIDISMGEITKTLSQMLQRYENLGYQVKETATLLDQVVTQQSVHVIKYRELELNQKSMHRQLEGLSSSMQNMMIVLDARLPPKDIVTKTSSDDGTVTVKIKANTDTIQKEIDGLVEQIEEKEKEKKEPTSGTLSPPPG